MTECILSTVKAFINRQRVRGRAFYEHMAVFIPGSWKYTQRLNSALFMRAILNENFKLSLAYDQ